jgi:hypothetical protein
MSSMGAQYVRRRVQEARESWRSYEALPAELAGELQPGWWLETWLAMEVELFQTWVNIRREFGIKLKLRLSEEQEQELMRATSREQMVEFSRALAPEQVVDSARLPRTPRAWAKWCHDALYCILLRIMTDGIEFSVTSLLLNKAIWEVKSRTLHIESLPPDHEVHTPTARALNRKGANTLIVLASGQPYAAGVVMQCSPDPVLAESATFALSGFAAANLSANLSFRHNRAAGSWIRVSEKTSSRQLVNRGSLPSSSF